MRPGSLDSGLFLVSLAALSLPRLLTRLLSLTLGDPQDLADIFQRVENIPRTLVRKWLAEAAAWDGQWTAAPAPSLDDAP